MSGKRGMHNMGRPRKYDIRREDLVRLRAAGYGRYAISKIYGCHETTILHWLVKFGLPTSKPLIARPRKKIEWLLARAAE